MKVRIEELKEIARQVLDLLGVRDYFDLQLTYALKIEGKWKVNFQYELHQHVFGSSAIRKIASFTIDAESGEIEGMWLDRSWR